MARGCVFRPTYTVKLPDGTRELRQSRIFWIRYRDGQGIKRSRAVSEKRQDAEDALAVALKDALSDRHGLPTQSAAMLPAGDLVQGYLDVQRARVSPKHFVCIRDRIQALVKGIRAVTAKDISADRVEAWLDDYAQGEPENGKAPPAVSTVNGYLEAVKAMLSWAVQRRKLPYNPLATVKRRPETEKARNRRPLSEDEAGRLLAAALDGPARRQARVYRGAAVPLQVQADCARQGRRNALAYRLMLSAGLRLHEAQALRWCDLDLDAALLFIRGDKGDKLTGRYEEKEIPLPPDTVQALAAWKLETRPDEDAPVADIPATLVRTLEDDLAAAGIPNPDTAGRVVDCHALRHTFGTWLGKRPDVDPKTVQALMRHKTAALTFGVYVHRDKGRMKAAAEGMPALLPTLFQPQNVQAASLRTGTDDLPHEALKTADFRAGSARSVQDSGGRNGQVLTAMAHSQPRSTGSQPVDSGSNPDGDTNEVHAANGLYERRGIRIGIHFSVTVQSPIAVREWVVQHALQSARSWDNPAQASAASARFG